MAYKWPKGSKGYGSRGKNELLWQKQWERLPSWLSPISFFLLAAVAIFGLAYAVRSFGDYTTDKALRERREKRAERRKKRREEREAREATRPWLKAEREQRQQQRQRRPWDKK